MTNEEAINHLKYLKLDSHIANVEALDLAINALEERPKGKWIISKDGSYSICSVCITRGGTQYDGLEPIPLCTSFCSNCGADMRSDV